MISMSIVQDSQSSETMKDRLEAAFGKEITSDFFTVHPTIEEMAKGVFELRAKVTANDK